MQTKKRKWKRPVAIIILVAAICSIFAVPSKPAEAALFNVDGVGGTISGPQAHAIFSEELSILNGVCTLGSSEFSNPDATFSYHTVGFIFCTKETNGNPTSAKNHRVNLISHRDRVEGSMATGYKSYDTYQFDIDALINWLVNDAGLTKAELLNNPTIYLNPIYVTKTKKAGEIDWDKGTKEYTSLTAILGAVKDVYGSGEWSGSAQAALGNSYDVPFTINLDKVGFEVRYVFSDNNDEESVRAGEALVGEMISAENAPSVYTYDDVEYTKSGYAVSYDYNATRPRSFSPYTSSFRAGKDYTVIWVEYANSTPPSGDTYVLDAKSYDTEMGVVEGDNGEIPAGKRVTVEASPNKGYKFDRWGGMVSDLDVDRKEAELTFIMPERDVTLTAYFKEIPEGEDVPEEDIEEEEEEPEPDPEPVIIYDDYIENRYYTTDKGYSMTEMMPRMRFASNNSSKAFQFSTLQFNNPYSVGTDTAGNEWYFLAEGETATYVHPKTYKGYSVDSSDIQYITELTFPETIACEGTEYTAVSIGGAYKNYSLESSSQGNYTFNTSYLRGERGYSYTDPATNEHYHAYQNYNTAYSLGVLGNGSFNSGGGRHQYWVDLGSSVDVNYGSSYIFTNTTLREITIPPTVSVIKSNAFHNCNALTKINGGEGVQVIEGNAFSTTIYSLSLSAQDSTKGTYNNSLYNESYTNSLPFTQTMKAYNEAQQLSSQMHLAEFPSLKTICSYAFHSRKNLLNVTMPESLETIQSDAFYLCRLYSIEIPNLNTVINGGEETLGRRGGKTDIIAEEGSNAFTYALSYITWYDPICDVTVTYHNNLEKAAVYTSTASFEPEYANIKKSLPRAYKQQYSSSIISVSDYFYLTADNKLYTAGSPATEVAFEAPIIDAISVSATNGYEHYVQMGNEYGTWSEKRISPVSETFVFLENEKIIKYNTIAGQWEEVCTLKGCHSFQTVTTSVTKQTGSTNSYSNESGSGYSSSSTERDEYESRLYFLNEKNNLCYMVLGGSYSAYTSGGSSSASGSYTNASTSSGWRDGLFSTTIIELPNPDNIDIAQVFFISTGGGYSKSTQVYNSYTDGSSEEKTYVADLRLPRILVVATNGNTYELTGSKSCGECKYEKYWNGYTYIIKGEEYLDESRNIKTISITDADYVWAPSIYKQKLESLLLSQDGDIYYGDELVFEGDYISLVKQAGEVFAVDKDGYLYLPFISKNVYAVQSGYNGSKYTTVEYRHPTSDQIIRLCNDADFTLISTQSTGSPIYDYMGSEIVGSETRYDVLLCDTKGRVWNYVQRDFRYNSSSNMGSQIYTAPSIVLEFDSPVVKIVNYTSSHDYYNSYYGRNEYENSYGRMLLTENGDVYMKGPSHRSIDEIYNYYYYYVSCGSSYNEWKKINGNVKVEDFCYASPSIFFLGKDGNTYRTGYSTNGSGVTTPSDTTHFAMTDEVYPTITSNASNSLWQVKTTMGGELFIGYHFVHKVYNNMFQNEGYDHTNWNTETDNSGDTYYPGDKMEVEKATTLFAQWEKAGNVIRYDKNGGSGYMDKTIVPIGESVTLPTCTYTKTGHEFTGWNTKADGTGTAYVQNATLAPPEGTTILYAQWKPFSYTLYKADDEYRVQPAVITKLADLVYDEEYTVPDALGPKESTVKYNLNATGSAKQYAGLVEGNINNLPTDYTTSSMEFKGWQVFEKVEDSYYYLSKFYESGTTGKNFAKNKDYPPVLFPYWSGSASYVKLPTATQPGYNFIGWSKSSVENTGTELYMPKKDANGTIASYRPSTDGTENLYAHYEPKTYRVSLVVPGDVIITEGYQSSVTMTFDEVVPKITPIKIEKYVFGGYYDKLDAEGKPAADATQYYDAEGSGQLVWQIYDGSVTELYAYLVSEIDVTLDGCGATKQEQTSVKVRYGEIGAINADGTTGGSIIPPERTGYIFQGYYTKKDGEGAKYFNADGTGCKAWEEDNVDTLYAKWTPITYTVKINYGAGWHPENLTSFTAKYDEAFSVSHPYANKPGYKFTGWNISNSKGSLPPGNMQTEFINLTDVDKSTVNFMGTYAWADDIYLITFVANPLDYQLLSTDVVFNEWTANGKVSQTDTVCTGYYLTVGGNSSGLYDKSQTPYGGAFPTFKATAGTTKPNGDSTFVGWNTSPDGSGVFYTSAPAVTKAEDGLVLYAIWSDAAQMSVTSDASVSDWMNRDVFVTLSGESDISGVYRMELLMKSVTGTDLIETIWFPAGIPSHTMVATENFRGGRSDLSNDEALTYYNRDKRSLTVVYSHQGRFTVDGAVYARSEQNSYPVTGASATNSTSFKIDKTAPAVTTLVKQKNIEDFAEALQNGSVTDLSGKLTTYFEVNADDTANAEYGAFVNNADVSGIHEVYVIVTDADNSASQKRYDLTLNNSVTTLDGTGVLSGKYTANIDLYAEFPSAVGLTCEIYVSDRAGNITKVTEQNLANFSVYAQIYNVNNNKNLSDGTAYFQAGEFGYVNIWTYGYVEGLSLDFGAVGEEAQREIEAGLLLPEYSLEFQEGDARLYIDSTKNSNLVRVDGIRIPVYFELEAEEGAYHSDGTPRFQNFTGTMCVLARKKTSYATASDDFVIYDKISNDYHYRVWPLE